MKKPTSYRFLIFVFLIFSGFITYAHASNSDTTIYVAAEKMPAYPGGAMARNTFIAKHIQYPGEAVKDHVSGTVYVAFVVERDGSLSHIKVLKGIGHGCDKEAMKIVAEMPKWIPGIIKGKPVRVRFTLPFSFNLQPNNRVFTHADEYPVFDSRDGLAAFFSFYMQYPVGIIKNKVIDTVKVFFVVEPDKRITHVKVNKTADRLNAYDYEAIRLVKNLKVTKPAYVKKHPVPLRLYVPIVFNYKRVDTTFLDKTDTVIDGKTFHYYCKDLSSDDNERRLPSFPGGVSALMHYLATNIHYPANAINHNEQGRVFVHFFVEPNGTISNIKVIKGVSPSLDAEAVRLVKKMPKWIPGINKGKPVRVPFTLPVKFTLR